MGLFQGSCGLERNYNVCHKNKQAENEACNRSYEKWVFSDVMNHSWKGNSCKAR